MINPVSYTKHIVYNTDFLICKRFFQSRLNLVPKLRNDVWDYILTDKIRNFKMSEICKIFRSENFDDAEKIKASSTMTEIEITNVEGSNANDNGGSGFPTPSASDENIIDIEFSEDNVVDECNSLNSHVSIHSSKEKPKSTDLTIIPENCHSVVIPEDPLELNGFVKTGQIFIDAASKLKNKKNITVEEYNALHKKAKEYGFIVLDAGLKLSLAIKNIIKNGGYRSDLHPNEGFRSKEQIIFEDFGLTDSQSRIFRKLTVAAVDAEKAYARENDTIPTLTHAVELAENKEGKSPKNRGENSTEENLFNDAANLEICNDIPDGTFDIIHADFGTLKDNFRASSIAKDNALLFIWANKNQLALAVDFIKSDDFELVDNSVFVNVKTKTGGYFKTNHRHILVGRKGKFNTPEFLKTSSVVYELEAGEGYTYYSSLIKRMYPDAEISDLTPKQEEACASSEEVPND